MWFVCFGERYVKIDNAGFEIEVRVLQVETQNLTLELVAIQLVGIDVGELENVTLAVMLVAIIHASGCLPVETQIVFEEVLAQQVLFQVKHFCQVICTQLHSRFADLLFGRWKLSAPIDEQDALIGVEQKLAREREACESRADD